LPPPFGKYGNVRRSWLMFGIHAGYGEEIITPSLGAELTGYGYYLNVKRKKWPMTSKSELFIFAGSGRPLSS